MSLHAGQILHLGGNNVIDRIQRAGLGDVNVPQEVIREAGNPKIVEKVPGEPDFTFSIETLDVTIEPEAWLAGRRAVSATASAGMEDDAIVADGTTFSWQDLVERAVNVPSPWKDSAAGSAGTIEAGHLVPGYYVTRVRYAFGVTDNAGLTIDIAGGSYYYNGNAPVEQSEVGDGVETEFTTDDAAVPYRIGGAGGTSFKSVFGVLVDGVLQVEGVDYTQAPTNTAAAGVATVTFTDPPADGAVITFAYFTTAARAFPPAVHASTIVKPAAVRGRHICLYLGSGGARQKVGGVQSASLEARVDSVVTREFCNEEIIGRTINGTDVDGDFVVRSTGTQAFLNLVAKVTGVDVDEVQGWLNTNKIPLEVQILNPKNPAEVLKTLYVDDAVVQVPSTSVQVNQPVDHTFRWGSSDGDFEVTKGARV